MVAGLGLPPGSHVLDLAAGTAQIGRLLAEEGHRVVSADISHDMIAAGHPPGPAVVAPAERLPFRDGVFDGVTFGYLLRYVDDVLGCLIEIARVTRPGGRVGMVEFGRPTGLVGPLWVAYTRFGLPALGLVAGPGWVEVGRFLGPSIGDFARRLPPEALAQAWRDAGLADVEVRRLSLGGGLVMWGRRR